MIDAEQAYRQAPLTFECWVKIFDKRFVNVIASCDPRESAQHWELRSESGTGHFELNFPGYTPGYIRTAKGIADGQWHALAMTFDGHEVKLYVDGQLATQQAVTRQNRLHPKPGALCLGMAIEGNSRITCNGLIDDVRISRTVRTIDKLPLGPLIQDPLTVGLWAFDQVDQLAGDPAWTPRPAGGIFPDWEKAQEKSWVDGRLREMDTGPTFNATFQYPSWSGNQFVYKGTAIRLGEKGEAAVLFDRCQLRYACGWTGGFLQHSDKRFGLLNTPKPAGQIAFSNTALPGWANSEGKFEPVPPKTTALPESWGRFRGYHLSGNRTVLEYEIGGAVISDAPWFRNEQGLPIFSRNIEIGATAQTLQMLVLPVLTNRMDARSGSQDQSLSFIKEGIATAVVIRGKGHVRATSSGAVLEVPKSEQAQSIQLYLWSGPEAQLEKFLSVASKRAQLPANQTLLKPGQLRWGQPLITQGELAPDNKPYVIDTLTIPYQNRHKALFFCSGVDFLANGDIALCTVHGDVWLVKGADASLKNLRWHRFATGLYHPLGLKVIGGVIHVLERGQITILHDQNQDGEADWHECLTNAWHTGPGEHAYDSNLETDAQGRFYFFKTGDAELPHGGCLLRCKADGSGMEVYSTGFRHPMALSVSPTGQVTGSDQEGNWIPSTRIDYFQQGGFYGFMPAHHRSVAPKTFDLPLCWVPRTLCNSAGGHSWMPDGKFGPLGGQLLHLSFGRCRIQYVLPPQKVEGIKQSGAIDLGLKFLSGIMRGRCNPHDGHFYVCGMNGWQTAAVRDGCLQRVRYTGQPAQLPVALSAHANGLVIQISEPLDPKTASDPQRFGLAQWNYRYSGEYGSKRWSVTSPNREGADSIAIQSATLLPDGKTIFLNVPNLRPAMQCQLTYDLRTKSGEGFTGDLYHTVHAVDRAFEAK